MKTYRSKQTIEAVQFLGAPIEGVTCQGTPAERQVHGCDSSRAHLLHVHTKDTGGMKVLKPGDWIFPELNGPWGTKSDAGFRSFWEVPPEKTPVEPEVSAVAGTFPADSEVPVADPVVSPLPPREPSTVDNIPVSQIAANAQAAVDPSWKTLQEQSATPTPGAPVVIVPEPAYEIRHYTDGTTASGTGPLPLESPGGAPAVSTVGETSVTPGPAIPEHELEPNVGDIPEPEHHDE
jgi:hypothetical protein